MLIIRFTDSKGRNIPDLQLETKDLTYSKIKQAIRSKNTACKNSRLKLIYNGRVLNDQFDIKQEITNKLTPENPLAYVHCVIGEELTAKELQREDEVQQVTTTQPEVIGFDRLLDQGLSQEDVDNLRQQFERIYDINRGQSQINDLEEEEQRQNYIRQLEERWINLTVNADGTTAAPAEEPINHVLPPTDPDSNYNEDFLVGLLIGMFLGVIGILFLVVDDSVFSKNHKIAITMGVFVNFSLAVSRGEWI